MKYLSSLVFVLLCCSSFVFWTLEFKGERGVEEPSKTITGIHDSTWIDVEVIMPDAVMDIRYATTNNFMKIAVYDCPRCYVRMKVALALLEVQKELKQQGLSLKFFDCYRPQGAQYKLWKKVPDPRYVANPRKGSIHNRGAAVDITVVKLKTKEELDMGTTYDYFGREAYWAYQHSESIQRNRWLLRNLMEKHGFKTVTTEWWHYSFRRAWFSLSNYQWEC